jgi:triosephosphate isomerase (TIM)
MTMLVVANWKMHGTRTMAETLLESIAKPAADVVNAGGTVVICPPFTLIDRLAQGFGNAAFGWGGQDCHVNTQGAHTGDVAAAMLKDCGAGWVILGHSERRADHAETNAGIATKVKAAHGAGLRIILCVGETLAERESGNAEAIVLSQLAAAYQPYVDAVAYEPVWAIGTGKVAQITDIEAMHRSIRGAIAPSTQVLYGGSVKAANAKEILATHGVDGVLVGGASLQQNEFNAILHAALSQQI